LKLELLEVKCIKSMMWKFQIPVEDCCGDTVLVLMLELLKFR
jgi:hypothetical protein